MHLHLWELSKPVLAVSTKEITRITGQRDLASGLDKDECVSRREQVSVFVSAKRKLVQGCKFGLPKWETRVCQHGTFV